MEWGFIFRPNEQILETIAAEIIKEIAVIFNSIALLSIFLTERLFLIRSAKTDR